MKLTTLMEQKKNTLSKSEGFRDNIEELTVQNKFYRRVLYTTKNSQLVVMSIEPGDEIGEEVHQVDQFIRFEKGQGKTILDGKEGKIGDGDAIVVPKGTKHNVINTSKTEQLKLYAIYSPPQHKKDTIHKTKEDDVEDHFDGVTDTD